MRISFNVEHSHSKENFSIPVSTEIAREIPRFTALVMCLLIHMDNACALEELN